MAKQDLPDSWALASLSDLGPIVSGGTPKTSDPTNFDGDISWVTPADLAGYTTKSISNGRRNLSAKGLETSSARVMPERSVLFSSRAPIGYVAIASNPIATNQGFKSIVVDKEIDESFVYFYLKSAKHLAEQAASGTTFKEISGSRFAQLPIPLAPLNEQRRIVEKIETLFAQLDQGEAALREVQRGLARYRQSVLKAAVTGELTRDWREANAQRLEPGRDLLARLLQTRRETWTGRGQYKEPTAPDTTNLPQLPEGWVWASFDQLFHVFGGATPSRRKAENWNGDIPWVSSGEVAFCRIRDTDEKITDVGYASCSTKLHPAGTVLLAMIGEGKTRGQAAILDVPACNNQNAAAIRVSESGIPPEYVYYFLLGNYEESRMKGQGGNQPALNGEKVKAFMLPLPSLVVHAVNNVINGAERYDGACVHQSHSKSPEKPLRS